MSREVMQQALDALAFAYNACESEWVQDKKIQPAMDAIETALEQPLIDYKAAYYALLEKYDREVLAQPAAQESSADLMIAYMAGYHKSKAPAQPSALPAPLTDEQIDEIVVAEFGLDADADAMNSFARAIEAAHGITSD